MRLLRLSALLESPVRALGTSGSWMSPGDVITGGLTVIALVVALVCAHFCLVAIVRIWKGLDFGGALARGLAAWLLLDTVGVVEGFPCGCDDPVIGSQTSRPAIAVVTVALLALTGLWLATRGSGVVRTLLCRANITVDGEPQHGAEATSEKSPG